MSHFQAIQIVFIIIHTWFHPTHETWQITKYDGFLWNWSNNAINDDDIFLLHLVSILSFSTKFDGPLGRNDRCWWHNLHNFEATLDLLMCSSSKSISSKTILSIQGGLMGKNKCITLTTWWWLITIGCSYTWTSSKWGHTMTSIFYASVTSTKIGVNILCTLMNILNIYWTILVTWGRRWLWYVALGGTVSWYLELIWMQLGCTKILYYKP